MKHQSESNPEEKSLAEGAANVCAVDAAAPPPAVEMVNPRNLKPHPLGSRMPTPSREVYEAMRESIVRSGIASPLLVTENDEILAGHTRCRIAVEVGLDLVPVRVMRGLSEAAMLDLAVFENFSRREMTPSQRAAWITQPEVFGALIESFKVEARAKMAQGAAKARERNRALGSQQPVKRAPQTRDLIAQRVGVSGKLIDAATTGWKVAPEKMQALLDGRLQSSVEAIAQADTAQPRVERAAPPTSEPKLRKATTNEVVREGEGSHAQDVVPTPKTLDVVRVEPPAMATTVVEAIDRGTAANDQASASRELPATNAPMTAQTSPQLRARSAWGPEVHRRNTRRSRNLHRFLEMVISLLDSGESPLVLIREARIAWRAEQDGRQRELDEARAQGGRDLLRMMSELPQEGDAHEWQN